jgi:predicted MFS family arabinose efflux permease
MLERPNAGAWGAWSVLRERVFRAVWLVDFVSNLGYFAQAVGAGWLMTSLTSDPHVVALVQTASSLPLFILAVPAGVLADLMDRRRLIRDANAALVVLAALLSVATWTGHVTVAVLLGATFALGAVAALQEPAWGALIPDIVPTAELPSAISLNGIAFNLPRVLGPPLAGLLVAVAGPAAAFAVNAASFVPVVFVMRPQRVASRLTLAAFRAGFANAISVARTSIPLRRVLGRNAAFSVCSSVLFSLLPLLARVHFHASAAQYGILIGALGAGSVAVAQVVDRIRAALGVAGAIFTGTVVLGVCVALTGLTSSYALACAALFVAGLGWLTVLSSLNTSIQFAVVPAHRAGGYALYLVTSQGISAFGAACWGVLADAIGVGATFAAAGTLFVVLGLVTRRIPVPWSA